MADALSTTLERVTRANPLEDTWSIVERDGGAIVESLLTSDTVDAINREVEPSLRAIGPGAKHDWFNFFFGANTKRLTDIVVSSPTFRDTVLQDPVVLGLGDMVMTRLSDSYWLMASQVIEIGPGNPRQLLHRDMSNYPIFLPQGPDSPEVVMNFLIALTEFRDDNGGTRVIPGSNRWPDYFDLDEETHQSMTVPVEMHPGDALLLSGKVIHGGGANSTTDEYRRALSLSFCPGFLVPEQAFPFEVPLDLARTLPVKTQQLLGFRSFHNYTNFGGSLWQHNYTELADYLDLD